MVICGSCASSDASATVSIITSHHKAYGTAPSTPDHPFGSSGLVKTRSSETPGMAAAQNHTSAPMAAQVSHNITVACSLTPTNCTAIKTIAQTTAQIVVVVLSGWSGFNRKAT